MNIISKPQLLRVLSRIFILIIIAKVLTLLLFWFLPNEGINYRTSASVTPEYHRYQLQGMLTSTPKSSHQPEVIGGGENRPQGISISNMLLKGLYKRNTGGFIIVAKKSTPEKSTVLGLQEVFGGYTLVEIVDDGAIFERSGARYTLLLSTVKQSPVVMQATKVDEGHPHQVARHDIANYAQNFDQIWKDISIVPLKKEGKIQGFKVTRIRANTPFAQLGLKRNDIIIKANNKPMTSFADALAIYQGIDKLEAIELVVLRNNQEKELIYEIY